MIDWDKVQVGDELTVRCWLTAKTPNYVEVVFHQEEYATVLYLKRESVVTHTAKPREFKVGDRVTWLDTMHTYQIFAIKGDRVWVTRDEYDFFPNLSDLTPA